jgi:hypothetical protein
VKANAPEDVLSHCDKAAFTFREEVFKALV